jgi:glutamine synthetase
MLPTSLESATIKMMRPDSVAREREVFGDDFVDHYGGTREHEVKLWNEAVTNWERKFFALTHFLSLRVVPVERYLELA